MTNEIFRTRIGNKPFPFMAFKWPFLLFSILVFTMSVYEIWIDGLNFGVDFKGGSKLIYQFDPSIEAPQIRSALKKLDIGEVELVPFGTEAQENQFIIRAKYVENQDIPQLIAQAFQNEFGQDKTQALSVEVVGPKVGADLQKKGILSLILTCVLILIYIGFRFDFLFSPGAIIALIHDVVITAGIFAFFGKEFNLPILAALLTILGYSINDTIVNYDRIRENLKSLRRSIPLKNILDISLTETFRRSMVTTLTTFIVAVILFFLGGGVLHDFAFCLMIGLIFGAYSSLFIASPIYLGLQKLFPQQGLQKLVTKEEQREKEYQERNKAVV